MNLFNQPRRAFTIIEIMIVVGIIAIVIAMGMPAVIQTMRKDPLRQAVSDIVECCSHARARAILNGVATELTIRAADGHLTVGPVAPNDLEHAEQAGEAGMPPIGGAADAAFSAQLNEDIAVQLLYVNLKDQMEAEEAHVRFYPNGTSDEFIMVLESKGELRKISLDCVTGLPDVLVIR